VNQGCIKLTNLLTWPRIPHGAGVLWNVAEHYRALRDITGCYAALTELYVTIIENIDFAHHANKYISLKVRGRLYSDYVRSRTSHGSETWPVRKENKKPSCC